MKTIIINTENKSIRNRNQKSFQKITGVLSASEEKAVLVLDSGEEITVVPGDVLTPVIKSKRQFAKIWLFEKKPEVGSEEEIEDDSNSNSEEELKKETEDDSSKDPEEKPDLYSDSIIYMKGDKITRNKKVLVRKENALIAGPYNADDWVEE